MTKFIKFAITFLIGLVAVAVVGITWYLGSMTSRACYASEPRAAALPEDGHFSSTYAEARAKFVSAVAARGGRLTSITHPLAGPDGDAISMDFAQFGIGGARNVLVLSSGTHGLEGFAGSGLQVSLLRSDLLATLPNETGVLLVHGVNPYGMAYLRRVNEDNVDLNRNFRDHDTLPPHNRPYSHLASAIAPASIDFWAEVRSWSRLIWYRITEGLAATRVALTSGQYSHPQGLFYGGDKNVWSNQILRQQLTDSLKGTENIIVIDVHTGLGPYGNAEVILNSPDSAPEAVRAKEIWGDGPVRSTVTGGSVSVHLNASLKLALQRAFPDVKMTAVSLEYGTLSGMNVFKALRAENWLHHHGSKDFPHAEAIKVCALAAFYPDDAQWRSSVLEQGTLRVNQALRHLDSR